MHKLVLLAFISFSSYGATSPVVQQTPVEALYIAHIDLPKSLSKNISLVFEEAKHCWTDATYYRETIDFGKIFHKLEKGELIERPIPEFLLELRNQLFELFKNRLDNNEHAQDYDNCIITMYQTGDGISPHTDRNITWATIQNNNYYFGESIIGLIIEPDTQQNLFFEDPKIGESSRFYLDEKPGTAFLFQGALRHEWKHGLLPVEKRRVSITFRKVITREHKD